MMNGRTPIDRLASLSVLETFGDTVQRVGDVLMGRGELTLPQVVAFVKESAKQTHPHLSGADFDEEDDEEDSSYRGGAPSNQQPSPRRPRLGVVVHGRRKPQPWDRSTVRASLVVLMQHGLVSARRASGSGVVPPSSVSKSRRPRRPPPVFHYRFDVEPALRLLRYAKYVEFFKRVVLVGDEVTASALQCLLMAGRLRTCDWILDAVSKQAVVDPRYTAREQAVEAAYKLESLGFVVPVHPVFGGDDEERGGEGIDSGDDDDEFEFEGPDRPKKRARTETAASDASQTNPAPVVDEDPIVVAILNGSAHYKNSLLPVGRVWRVNFHMFHAYQRAYQLGRLVAERYGHKVQSCGSLVTAALKHRAQVQHNPNERAMTAAAVSSGVPDPSVAFVPSARPFSVIDIIKYVPKAVLQILEKKPGGLHLNLAKAFDDLVMLAEHPVVIKPSSVASNNETSIDSDIPSTRYEVHVGSLTRYLQERIIHQIVSDRHGVVASRVISILWRLGYLEAETIAEHAMVPVKEAREVLHCLYKSNYVDLLQLSTTGSGGGIGGGGAPSRPSTALFGSYHTSLYLWGVRKLRLKHQVLDNVARAYVNVRLRRRNELDVGKQWIQRAQQADDTDENDHENDRLNYTKFCLGLERLDVAALQLDDTLLALNDFC